MAIHLKNVSWISKGTTILHNVNWDVQPGEHWAIVGLNGSGKTTLLNLINGYIWPSSGQVSVLGHTFGSVDIRKLRKNIGWVSSSLQEKLYPNDTAKDIVLSGKFASIGLYEEPEGADLARAEDILAQLRCSHLANRFYTTLSQGEKQKILIARALMASPKLLIFDEPCTGLDVFSREQLLSTIQDLGSRPYSPTLIYVSHHIEEILPVFSHTLLLRRGEVYAAGETAKLLTSRTLSQFFEHAVGVRQNAGRFQIRLINRR